MKKYLISLILLTTFFVIPSVTFAQSDAINPYCRSSVWVCPNITKTNPEDRLDSHLTLSGSNLPTNQQVYIVCGILTKGEWAFTSGSNSIDQKLCLGPNNYTKLNTTYDPVNNLPYWLTVNGSNPTQTIDGNLTVTVESISKTNDANGNDAEHTCYFVYQTHCPDINLDFGVVDLF